MTIGMKWQSIDADPSLLLVGRIEPRGDAFLNGQGVKGEQNVNMTQGRSSVGPRSLPDPVSNDDSSSKLQKVFDTFGDADELLKMVVPKSEAAMSAH